MLVEFTYWAEAWRSFGEKEHGIVEIIKSPSVGASTEFITGVIKIKYLGNNITISQGASKVDYANSSLSFLIFEYQLKNNKKVNLSINQRDFFNTIFFLKRVKTGNHLFDKKYFISCSHKILAIELFTDSKIQNLFLSNPLLVFNISTKKGITKIIMKLMGRKLYSMVEMKKALEDFKYILSKLSKT